MTSIKLYNSQFQYGKNFEKFLVYIIFHNIDKIPYFDEF